MAYIPQFVKNSSLSSDTLNAIGADIGVGVTVINNDLDSLHNYGKVVMGASVMQNQFLGALVNRVARAEYTSRAFRSPLAKLKKGILEFGETVEEIFVEIQRGVQRRESIVSEQTNPFTPNIPDVKTAFHLSNLRARYETTIRNVDLRKAFLNFSGVDDLIARIVEKVYTEHNYDEFLMTKYVLARRALERINASKDENLGLTSPSDEQLAKGILKTARKFAKLLPIIKTEYNIAGVHTHTPTDALVCFLTADAGSNIDVNALAGAFNMEKAEFVGRIIDVDTFSFTTDEIARICAITGINTNAFPITEDEMSVLEKIPCILADENLLQIYDTIEPRFTEQYNAADDYWNYFLHIDQVFSTSPFMNIVVIDNNSVYTVTKTLTHATGNNSATTAKEGSAYAIDITAGTGYNLGAGATVSLTMGGDDIKSECWSVDTDGVGHVSIPFVTGNIALTVTADANL